MISIQVETLVPVPFQVVVDNFSEDLFQALAPAFPPSKLISFDGDSVGGLVEIRLGIPPLSQVWISEIISRSESEGLLAFVDKGIQLPPPLREWEHKHVVKSASGTETIIIDDITCTSGYGWMDTLLKPFILKMFQNRTPVYQRYFDELSKKNAE